MKKFLTLCMFAIVSCVHVETIRYPDGWLVYITCKYSQSYCYQEADIRCPNGYTVDKAGGKRDIVVTGVNGNIGAAPTYNGYLLVKCQ